VYLRRHTRKKNGKAHTYWQLVRSVRTGSKVRQQTVAYLGELDAEGRARASALAQHMLGPKAKQPSLFKDDDDSSAKPIKVHVDRVQVERSRSFGDVWLAWTLWRTLGLDEFCKSVMPKGRETVPWAEMAAILVLARFCEPSSELHIAEDWYPRSALDDILGIQSSLVHHTRLYQGLDALLPHKEDLEKHLKGRFGELFQADFDLLLYDVTSTYFEGEANANKMAQRGHSRDKRRDCKQVCIGLVVSREGFPLGYEVFAGNRTDVTTVEEVVESMESKYGKANRVWVMDRGMVSEANLEWLRCGDRKYLIGTPKSELRKWERELVEQEGWHHVRDGLEVKTCAGPEGDEVFLICRSSDRRRKEAAMHERFSTRIQESLESLSRRLTRGRKAADRAQVERQIGRLLQRNSRAAGKFNIHVHEDSSRGSGLRVEWKIQEKWSEWARLTEGTYILRTNVTDWKGEELWRAYIQLHQAEAAFRIEKSDLRIRPIWHQREERVLAHILVCFLAFAMWKTLEAWQARAGLGNSPRTIIEEMKRIHSVDVVLPLESGREMRVRCVAKPEKDTAALLSRLGLTLPTRLHPPPLVDKM
jgi:transposase